MNELIFSINNISAIDSTGTATGGYAISYASNGSIYTSIYSSDGTAEVTDHLIFAGDATITEIESDILSDGSVALVWEYEGPDGNESDIKYLQFNLTQEPVFASFDPLITISEDSHLVCR